jgi:hypothetical protein
MASAPKMQRVPVANVRVTATNRLWGRSAEAKIFYGIMPRPWPTDTYKDREGGAVSELYGWESGGTIVTMMQPAESHLGQDTTGGSGTRPAIRRSLLESKMPAVVMIVVDLVSEQTLQNAFVNCDDVI